MSKLVYDETPVLQNRIDALEAQIAELNAALERLRDTLADKDAKIERVQAQRDKLKAEYQQFIERQR